MSYAYMLKAHLILVTKYRKVLLVNNLNEQMKEIIYNISKKSKFIIEVYGDRYESFTYDHFISTDIKH